MKRKGRMMRTISKASIALIIAVAMCLTPLLVAEDSDAATMDTGESGASFTADSISDDDLNRLMTGVGKDNMAAIIHNSLFQNSNKFDFADIEVKNARDIEMARGMRVDEECKNTIIASKETYDISFTATASVDTELNYSNFNTYLLELYEYLGGWSAPSGSTLVFDGTITYEKCYRNELYYSANNANDYVLTKEYLLDSNKTIIDGTFKYTSAEAGSSTKEFDIHYEGGGLFEVENLYDFGDMDIKDVIITTPTKKMLDYKTNIYHGVLEYNADGKKDGYDYTVDQVDLYGTEDRYEITTPTIETGSITCDNYHYYGPSLSLFTSVADPALANDDALKEFLGEIGSTSESFSDIDSIADDATSSFGSSKPNTSFIFYILIAILGIGVIVMAALMLKKK